MPINMPVSPPLPTCTELASTSTDAAVLEQLGLEAPPEQPPLLPNGDVPALPLPPHAATSERVIAAKAHFRIFITVVSLDGFGQWFQRAAVRSVTTLGVRKMSNSVFEVVKVFVLNR